MQSNSEQRLISFGLNRLFGHRLGRALLLTFLGLAVVPMAVVSIIGYQSARHQVAQAVRQNLRMAAEIKSGQLRTFSDDWKADAAGQRREPVTGAFFSSLDQILRSPVDGVPGMRVYLIDADRTVLAGTTGGQHPHSDAPVDTAQTQQWQRQRAEGVFDGTPVEPFVYAGPAGTPVVGTHVAIGLGNMPGALILEIESATAFGAIDRLRRTAITVVILTLAAALVASAALARWIVGPVREASRRMSLATQGRFSQTRRLTAGNEIAGLTVAIDAVLGQLKTVEARHETQSRFLSGLTRLHRLIGGEQDLGELCLNTLEFLSERLDLCQADFYILRGNGMLECISRFPGHPDADPHRASRPGVGRVGQAALNKASILFHKDADSGQVRPVGLDDQGNLIAVPLAWRESVKGVLDLEKMGRFNRFDRRFMQAAAEIIVVALNAALTRLQEEALLARTRKQAKKLKLRETALEENTRELKAHTRAFQVSEEKLQLKQLELEAANAQMVKNAADLEAHMAILEKQKRDMQKQNQELAETHRELAEKARQLEISSRYKTEFMANMSHELRTPLNSILLLSRLLFENKEKTLTAKQSEFARTVNSAGEDLLNLINEILDLAKVESGKMEVDRAPVEIRAITNAMLKGFAPLAEQRGVAFRIHVDPDVPEQVITDRKRMEQIVKNFLSNAFKFTAEGTVCLEIAVYRESLTGMDADMHSENNCLTVSVVDTGIGIPSAKHQMVFEAFQQVDGSTRRKYGGTGLGLSISRELARILGGKIKLESQEGQGSRFTLYLPIIPAEENEPNMIRSDRPNQSSTRAKDSQHAATRAQTLTGTDPVADDRKRLVPGDPCMLIIDADANTTEPLKACAHRNGYKVLVAEQFSTGLHFADYYLPTFIFVNLQLPDGSGWEMVPRIKANPKSRHIPVLTLSPEKDAFKAAVHGAAGHVSQPVTASVLETAFQHIERLRSTGDRKVLVVAPAQEHSLRITKAIGGSKIRTMTATTAVGAAAVLKTDRVHAVIVHPELDVAEQHNLLTALERDPLPVYQYSGTPLKPRATIGSGPGEMNVNLKTIHTPDQLLLALVADLHLPPDHLDDVHRHRLRAMDNQHNVLKGRKVLLVDDDMRTVFAVSNVLEDQGTTVITGKTGKESLDKLDGFPDIDLVLMDVMIADVDGYQAIREIRSRNRYRTLPVIALTARAMRGDRAKCIRAGADDYLAKPVNLDKLTSMLKIWLEPQRSAPGSIEAETITP